MGAEQAGTPGSYIGQVEIRVVSVPIDPAGSSKYIQRMQYRQFIPMKRPDSMSTKLGWTEWKWADRVMYNPESMGPLPA